MKHNIYIIGAGGVGSWLTPSLAMLAGKKQITVVDGDKLEAGNLNRQLFHEADIGSFKSHALADHYDVQHEDFFYTDGRIEHIPGDILMVAVDNNPARRACLDACDRYGCRAILMANERTSAEAAYYQPDWKDTSLDPRVREPKITTDATGDPRRAAVGCTGTAQEKTPQLVSANLMAASLGQWLYVAWVMEFPSLDKKIIPFLPHLLLSNMTRLETQLVGEQPTEARV